MLVPVAEAERLRQQYEYGAKDFSSRARTTEAQSVVPAIRRSGEISRAAGEQRGEAPM
jgi:hypothetical protein